MTVSKCIQLIIYGLIAGYELPRMASRFKPTKFPENDYPDIPLSLREPQSPHCRQLGKLEDIPLSLREPLREPALRCNPSKEPENS